MKFVFSFLFKFMIFGDRSKADVRTPTNSDLRSIVPRTYRTHRNTIRTSRTSDPEPRRIQTPFNYRTNADVRTPPRTQSFTVGKAVYRSVAFTDGRAVYRSVDAGLNVQWFGSSPPEQRQLGPWRPAWATAIS